MRRRISVQLIMRFSHHRFLFISVPSTESQPPSLQATPRSRLGHKEALSGIPTAHFTSSGWMGKQVSAIYHSFRRKRARQDL